MSFINCLEEENVIFDTIILIKPLLQNVFLLFIFIFFNKILYEISAKY